MNDSSDPHSEASRAIVPAEPTEAAPDAHGYDPADYKWVPVLRKARADGWTPQRQVEFIATLADTGSVEQAAREVGMSQSSCYRLRRAPGAENFAAAWDAAIGQAVRKLVDLAFDRAVHGSDEPVFDRDGAHVGRRMRQNDRLLMFLLRAYMPERFRHAHHDPRTLDEPLPAAAAPIAAALERLEPAMPAAPHRLMPPAELDVALQCADMLDGELPPWHRYRPDPPPVPCPIVEQSKRDLAAAAAACGGSPPLPPAESREPEIGEEAFLE